MQPPARVTHADYLVVESTYGNRLHAQSDPRGALAAVITRTAQRRGVVVIPAFAVGRAQTLLYHLHALKTAGRMPDIPVFLNSPMAVNANTLYHRHTQEHRLTREACDAMCASAQVINSVEESMALNERKGPMVIISASGMATGGRVLHHLKRFAPDARNTILFAGFQAGGTRGASIVAGAETVKIHGAYVPIRAEVAVIDDLSAHADAGEIIDWLRGFTSAPRQTFITHGEPAAADALRIRVTETLRWPCMVPGYRDQVTLT